MKTKIEKFKLERVSLGEIEVDLPEEPIYIFEFGRRVMYGIFPKWTTWQVERDNKPEEIWEYDVITISESFSDYSIEKFTVRVSDFDRLYNSNNKISTKKERVVKFLIDGIEQRSIRTEEQFLHDYNSAIYHLVSIITH